MPRQADQTGGKMQEKRQKYHATQLNGPGQQLPLVERDMPVPGPGEMLVKILACAVCDRLGQVHLSLLSTIHECGHFDYPVRDTD
jgi:hypothetical protein